MYFCLCGTRESQYELQFFSRNCLFESLPDSCSLPWQTADGRVVPETWELEQSIWITLDSGAANLTMVRVTVLLLVTAFLGANAFAPTTPSRRVCTNLQFGIPTFGPKKDKEEEKDPNIEEKKIGFGGFVQLVTAGLGAPFLGDYQGVDKESGKFMFSLEANNLVDESGESKQTKMPYFESGWVDPKDLEREQKRKEEGFRFPWQK